jgi:hypothetical protein
MIYVFGLALGEEVFVFVAGTKLKEVLQLCSHPVIGWSDAPLGLFGLRSIQVAAI